MISLWLSIGFILAIYYIYLNLEFSTVYKTYCNYTMLGLTTLVVWPLVWLIWNLRKEIPMIKHTDFNDFCIDYWKNKKYPHLRFGQAFCDTFNIHDNVLFYEDDHRKAFDIISTMYLSNGRVL